MGKDTLVEPVNLLRQGALAAVLAGTLLLTLDVLELLVFGLEPRSAIAATGAYIFIMAGFLLATLLALLGLVGLYAGQAEAAGRLGFISFLAAFVGTVLFAGYFWAQGFFAPVVAGAAPDIVDSEPGWLGLGAVVSFFFFALGWLLFGVATVRARVYPRWAALLLVAGAVLVVLFRVPVSSVVFDLALVWLGLALLTGRARQPDEPAA